MPFFIIVKGPNEGQRFELNRPRSALGRDQQCDILLKPTGKSSNDAISRRHALVVCENGRYFIEDGDGHGKPSHNGTSVNGVRLTPGSRVPLHPHDIVKICNIALSFQDAAATQSRGAALDPARGMPTVSEPDTPSSIHAAVSHDSSSFFTQPAGKLKLLLEISNHLSNTLELDDLLPQVVESLLRVFKQADRCLLILSDEAGELVPRIFRARHADAESRAGFSASIVRHCLKTMQGLLSNDVHNQYSDSDSVTELALRSVMAAPLWVPKGKAFGVLLLDASTGRRKFTEEDLHFLMGVASQSSIALANARFYRDALARERLTRDLELAAEVQRSFLPRSLPQVAGYEFFGCNESALEVGGDYYDFIPLPDGRLGVLLADVAGKGVAAALLIARFSAEARVCLHSEPDLAAAVRQLDRLIHQLKLGGRFITLATLALDPVTHTVTIVNAGHPSPLLLHRATGAVAAAAPPADAGPPLGVVDNYAYESRRLTLEPGDSLVIFSDGVTEAINREGQQLRVPGLLPALGRPYASVEELGERILQTVSDHAAGCDQYDDITLVCVSRLVQA